MTLNYPPMHKEHMNGTTGMIPLTNLPPPLCQPAEQYSVPEATMEYSLATNFSKLDQGEVESLPAPSLEPFTE